MLLAGDVGATKTTLAVFSKDRGPRNPVAKETFDSGSYDGVESIVDDFLSKTGANVDRASLGVAGPVVGRRVKITNLPWLVDAEELEEEFDLSQVRLLNDLVAVANAVPFLEADEVHTLSEGEPEPKGALGVIAPGTGLGEGFLTWDGERYQAHGSEGSHVDFAPASTLQVGLLRYLWESFEHVSYERVCSGMGLPNIYAYLKDRGETEEPPWLAEALSQADDLTPIIVRAALDEGRACALCRETLDTFVAILGAEAGNLALKAMTTGGMYVGGGIPPRILPALERASFLASFWGKGRLTDIVKKIPLHVIMEPEAALLGAACRGLGL